MEAMFVGGMVGLIVAPILSHFEFSTIDRIFILVGAGLLTGHLV